MLRTLAVALGTLGLAACASTGPSIQPQVDQVGAAVVRYRGPQLEAVIGTRYANTTMGDDWLMLDAAITGATSESVEIDRTKVWIKTPAGEVVPLASQKEFADAYTRLQRQIQHAAIAADPLDYWVGRIPCSLELFVAPGSGIAQSSVSVDDRRVCSGRLFFALPHGVQPGHYELGMKLEEGEVEVPFELREAR